MAENQHSEFESEQQTSPFEAPKVAEVVSKPIERESLSIGGKLAWLVIFIVMAAMIALTAFSLSNEESQTEANSSDLFQVQLQARTLVGQKSFIGGSMSSSSKDEDEDVENDEDSTKESEKKPKRSSGTPIPESLNDGTYEQRLCYVLLINENNGSEAATEKLADLDEAAEEAGFEKNEVQTRLREIVGTLLESHQEGDMDAAPLSDDDREYLKTKLGWIGQLALVPEGTRNKETRKELMADASRAMGLMMIAMILGLLTFMAGVALAIVFTILFATKKLEPKFMTRGKSLNVYVETFALWMVFFFVGPQATSLVIQMVGLEMTTALDMTISIGFFFGSLIVLIYPIMRGITFTQLCNDIGWKWKGGFVDLLVSPLNYIAGTPLMLCGMFCVVVLTVLATMMTPEKPFGTGVAAGHPIQDIIANGQWLSIAYVVLMACVAAPIVEETMFRGVLYRHLRELSGSWARWGSVIFAAVFNGLIFAAIHPQGFVAIPLLTCLAINFSLAREWRDSLIAPVIMHAINNGAVTTLMLLMMS